MNGVKLRDSYEIPLYVLSVLVNLLIIALILVGALLLGYLNALAGEPLSGPAVDVIRAAFFALLLLVPGLVLYRQLTRAGTRGSAVRLSRRQFPDIYAVKENFARKLGLQREPEIYLMSGNGTLNAFAASTFGYDFVVIHSELGRYIYKSGAQMTKVRTLLGVLTVLVLVASAAGCGSRAEQTGQEAKEKVVAKKQDVHKRAEAKKQEIEKEVEYVQKKAKNLQQEVEGLQQEVHDLQKEINAHEQIEQLEKALNKLEKKVED